MSTDVIVTVARAAFSINEFCDRNRISKKLFNKLRKSGRGPALMELDGTIRISAAAEAAWQQARENPTKKEAKAIARRRVARVQHARKAGKLSAASPHHISKTRHKNRSASPP
jgi:predicted negative regulator of RcsB-dependent stress response